MKKIIALIVCITILSATSCGAQNDDTASAVPPYSNQLVSQFEKNTTKALNKVGLSLSDFTDVHTGQIWMLNETVLYLDSEYEMLINIESPNETDSQSTILREVYYIADFDTPESCYECMEKVASSFLNEYGDPLSLQKNMDTGEYLPFWDHIPSESYIGKDEAGLYREGSNTWDITPSKANHDIWVTLSVFHPDSSYPFKQDDSYRIMIHYKTMI